MENYKSRIVDEILEKKLKGKGAVLIQGPKWCGKTTTAEQISKSILYMAKSDEAETLKKLESRIDITKMQKPSFLLVLTAIGKYAYQREDGVYVVPIGCLKN